MDPQAYCTLRDLEILGLARSRLQQIPIADRRVGIYAASEVLSPFLRARYGLPLAVDVRQRELDTSGLTGGATVSWTGTPSEVQGVGVRFVNGGVAGAAGPTYQVTLDAGAVGAVWSADVPLPSNGQVTIDGVTWTVVGTLADGDGWTYTTRPDAGTSWAAAQIAAWTLIGAGGVDAKTLESMQYRYEQAMRWAAALLEGAAQLDQKKDATPERAELGPLGSGQNTPWGWLDQRRSRLWRRE